MREAFAWGGGAASKFFGWSKKERICFLCERFAFWFRVFAIFHDLERVQK
jgi:hypothetical protein